MAFFDWFTGERPALVEQAFKDIIDMVDRGRTMFTASTGYLLDNEILDVDLDEMDQSINHREQHCRSAALEYITSSPGNQLIFVLKILSIVQEAERIGDLAKSLASVADLAHAQRLGSHVEPIRKIRNRIATNFDLTLQAFRTHNTAKAEEVLRHHQQLKEDIADYVTTVSNDDTISPNLAVVYALGARMLGRTSSHLANIASTVVFPFEQIRRTHPDDND